MPHLYGSQKTPATKACRRAIAGAKRIQSGGVRPPASPQILETFVSSETEPAQLHARQFWVQGAT